MHLVITAVQTGMQIWCIFSMVCNTTGLKLLLVIHTVLPTSCGPPAWLPEGVLHHLKSHVKKRKFEFVFLLQGSTNTVLVSHAWLGVRAWRLLEPNDWKHTVQSYTWAPTCQQQSSERRALAHCITQNIPNTYSQTQRNAGLHVRPFGAHVKHILSNWLSSHNPLMNAHPCVGGLFGLS